MIFARKDKHFWAFEARMREPLPPPPADRNAPALWVRAREMFAALMEHAFSLARLATRPRLSRPQRHDILKRLIPVEKLTRFLLTVDAITFLLMTPEGARLRRTIRPAARAAREEAAPQNPCLMPAPGWHTIAATHPRIDPRIAEREAREAALSSAMVGAHDDALSDGHGLGAANPSSWQCRFHATPNFNPYTDEPESDSDLPPAPQRRARIELLGDDSYFPRLPAPAPLPPSPSAPAPDSPLGPHAALARRIEALARVIANPEVAMRRLARRLAAMPLDDLWPCDSYTLADRWWLPARLDLFRAAELFCRALIVFCRAQFQKLEPG